MCVCCSALRCVYVSVGYACVIAYTFLSRYHFFLTEADFARFYLRMVEWVGGGGTRGFLWAIFFFCVGECGKVGWIVGLVFGSGALGVGSMGWDSSVSNE
jgi:hypothetical protein